MERWTLAIDGPGGAGKSSVADELAARFGALHLDTGAMYRAFAWKALKEGASTRDEAALAALAAGTSIDVRYENGAQRTLIDGTDVTGVIRTPEISMAASDVSKFAAVRVWMVRLQQALARRQSMILDGRDIGLRVLPDATLKIFLTASPEVRAQRRYDELRQRGDPSAYESVLEDVRRRDHQDSTRAVDPLKPTPDAVIVDTSDMTQAQVVEHIARLLEERL